MLFAASVAADEDDALSKLSTLFCKDDPDKLDMSDAVEVIVFLLRYFLEFFSA
jgi:hypothetical protein